MTHKDRADAFRSEMCRLASWSKTPQCVADALIAAVEADNARWDEIERADALLVSSPHGWQPIAFCPTVGPVLMSDGVLRWISHYPMQSIAQGSPTHWMPLPAPPLEARETSEDSDV